jgi:hypothetical protein
MPLEQLYEVFAIYGVTKKAADVAGDLSELCFNLLGSRVTEPKGQPFETPCRRFQFAIIVCVGYAGNKQLERAIRQCTHVFVIPDGRIDHPFPSHLHRPRTTKSARPEGIRACC